MEKQLTLIGFILLMTLMLSLTAYEAHNVQKVSEAIAKGIDPIKASCAIRGLNQPVCNAVYTRP